MRFLIICFLLSGCGNTINVSGEKRPEPTPVPFIEDPNAEHDFLFTITPSGISYSFIVIVNGDRAERSGVSDDQEIFSIRSTNDGFQHCINFISGPVAFNKEFCVLRDGLDWTCGGVGYGGSHSTQFGSYNDGCSL